nr:glycoside hydrolase family 6 protein [Streptomyces chryseus]
MWRERIAALAGSSTRACGRRGRASRPSRHARRLLPQRLERRCQAQRTRLPGRRGHVRRAGTRTSTEAASTAVSTSESGAVSPGAGLGERRAAHPAPGTDPCVWMKPTGESDGSSSGTLNDEGKRFDQMCELTYGGNRATDSTRHGSPAGPPCRAGDSPARSTK